MFGEKNKSATPKATGNKTTLIAIGAQVSGDISFNGNLEIEGVVKGNVSSTDAKALTRVLRSGKIEGELSVPRAIINGEIKGDVYISEHLELAENAVIEGDVYYAAIETVKGARINGRLIFKQDKKHISAVADPSHKKESKR